MIKNNTAQLLRVTTCRIDDLPELEDEEEDVANHNENSIFKEFKNHDIPLSILPKERGRYNSRHESQYSPPQLKHLDAKCKPMTPSAPTTDTSSDLKFAKDIISKLNITSHYQETHCDDNHLSIIDEHPTTLL